MTMFYVATRACYVLVEAASESEARRLGQPALQELHAELGTQIGRDLPVEIHVVRPATDDEVEMWKWHQELLGQ
jgi:hypothetical protein